MEPRNAGTGNVAADQSAATSPSTTKTLGTNATQDKNRTQTKEGVSMSPPGTQTQQQISHGKTDSR